MRFLIDTDWLIHYLNNHPGVVQRLGEFQEDGLALSIISLADSTREFSIPVTRWGTSALCRLFSAA